MQHTDMVRCLHWGYGKLSCASGETVTLYDTSQGALHKISVSII